MREIQNDAIYIEYKKGSFESHEMLVESVDEFDFKARHGNLWK